METADKEAKTLKIVDKAVLKVADDLSELETEVAETVVNIEYELVYNAMRCIKDGKGRGDGRGSVIVEAACDTAETAEVIDHSRNAVTAVVAKATHTAANKAWRR